MRVLFTSHPGLGHVNGLLALGRRLQARGHEVRVAGAPSVVAAFGRGGVEGTVIVPEPLWSDEADTHREVPVLSAVDGRQHLTVVHGELGIKRRAMALLEPLDELVRSWRPRVLVRDATEMAAWMVAERHGLPHVPFEVSSHWTEQMWDAGVGDYLRDLRAAAGLPAGTPTPASGMYRYLHISNAPRALLDPAVPLPPTSMDLAPSFFERHHAADPVQVPSGHVYVAFGTVYRPPEHVVRAVVDELAAEFPGVVVASASLRSTGRVVAAPYLPQSDYMAGCAAVVCHGGRNTVLTAAAHGVPVVCAPIGSDHFDVADAVARAGIGVSASWTADALSAAVRAVTGDDGFRRRASAVRQQVAAMPTLDDVVDELVRRFGPSADTPVVPSL